jgi:DNA polymerase-3 subunit gamma/tau
MPPVIARRYRPQRFEDVIGQEAAVRTLRNAITSGRIAHGYIFSGHRGIGKTTVARILAKALNCRAGDGPTAEPCGECDSCREVRDGNAVDVIEIDAASNRGIDEIRALRERVRYRPARDRYKFFILDEAHQLTGDAFNALLKTLEEPPEWAVFVLATTEPESLPATIRSRCQHFAFRAVGFEALRRQLEAICAAEQAPAEREALELIAEAGEGSVRDALSLLDQALSYAEPGGGLKADAVRALLGRIATGQIEALLQQVAADSTRGALQQTQALLEAGASPAQLCAQLAQAVRNALLAQASPDLLETSERERAAAIACGQRFREEELTRFLQILLRAAGGLRFGQQERLHLELAILEMLHARRLSSLEEVLAALGESGAGPAPGPAQAAGAAPTVVPQPAPRAAPAANAPAAAPVAVAASGHQSAAAAPAPSGDVRQQVLAALEAKGKQSLHSIAAAAEWRWEGAKLELAFAPEHADLAALAALPDTRKALAAACLPVAGRSPEILVTTRAGAAAAAARPAAASNNGSDTPEARAGQHPLLRQLKETIPSHVLTTRALETGARTRDGV